MEERRHTMSASARGELARVRALEYKRAGRRKKSAMLDDFVAATGVSRKTAMELLARPPSGKRHPRGCPKKRYGPDVQAALEALWAVSGYVCSKRLVDGLAE